MLINKACTHATCGSFEKTSHLKIPNFCSVTCYTIFDFREQLYGFFWWVIAEYAGQVCGGRNIDLASYKGIFLSDTLEPQQFPTGELPL